MRLDHLLSKEHLTLSSVQSHNLDECSRVVAHGWNIDFGDVNSTAARVRPFGARKEQRSSVASPAHCWVLRDRAHRAIDGLASIGPGMTQEGILGRGWNRPYVENYTVDASILDRHLRVSIYRSRFI